MPIADKVFEKNGYKAYGALTQVAEELIVEALASLDLSPDVTSRTKSIKSINEKILRENYADFQNEMRDISGVRVTCITTKQKDEAIEILQKTFEVIEHKASISDPNEMGYVDEKLILKLGDRYGGQEYEFIRDIRFEVQLRFVFMDAWAKFSHKFAYKDESSIPTGLLRKIQTMGAACEMLDGLADDCANAIERLRSDIVKELKPISESGPGPAPVSMERLPINMESLQAYLEVKYPGRPVDRQIQSLIIRDINPQRYKTIADIDRAVTHATDFLYWYVVKQPNLFESGADYVTKALGWTDPEFRQKHPFGKMTREAFREYSGLRQGQKLPDDPRPTREVQKALHSLFAEGVRQMNILIPTIENYDDAAQRLTLRKWQEQVLEKLEEARVSVPVMSRFETFHKFAPEFHVTEGKGDHQKLLEGIWNEKLKRLRAIIDNFDGDA